ncbi:MAG: RNA 2',3'-cyclic phosphodiesterase [Chloroflexi bacterium]|nr:RNA 2',3'-cyclic phosphodiesterase [Chloroflexota bacterium]
MADPPLRLFVSVELPQHVRGALSTSIERLRSSLGDAYRWVRPEAVHLTLRFLGNVEQERVAELAAALEAAVGPLAAFELRLDGTGVFPNARAPSVVWAGLGGESAALVRLVAAVGTATAGVGEPAESRPYVPHLTLGRVRGRLGTRDAGELAARLRELTYEGTAPFRVDGVSLMQSEIGPAGARYTRLAYAPLG